MMPQSKNESYGELARKLREDGWYQPAMGRMLFELGIHLTMCFGGLTIAVTADNIFLKALAFLLSGVVGLGIATNTHTASHYATGRGARLNRFLTYAGLYVSVRNLGELLMA